MIVGFDGSISDGQNTTWPSTSVTDGQRGFAAFFDAVQSELGGVVGGAYEEAYLPPGGHFEITVARESINEVFEVNVRSDPSLTAFDLIATLI